MILKFIQAESQQPILIMRSAIVSVIPDNWKPESQSVIWTTNGPRFEVLGTVEQVLAQFVGEAGLQTMAIAPIG